MGLSKAFSSLSGNTLKLGRLHTVPTTEDLLFVLSTAQQNKKTAELPFKNPNNQWIFSIKVSPPTLQHAARWTFTRCDDSGDVALWTRETNEVMIIQGKIKIESNYTGVTVEEVKAVLEASDDMDEARQRAADYDWETNPVMQNLGSEEQQFGNGEEMTGQATIWHTDLPVTIAEPETSWPTQKGQENGAPAPAVEQTAAWEQTPEHRAAWPKDWSPDGEARTDAGNISTNLDLIDYDKEQPLGAEADAQPDHGQQTEEAPLAETQASGVIKGKSKKARARAKAAAAKAAALQEHHQSDANEAGDVETNGINNALAEEMIVTPPATLHSEVLLSYLSSLSDPATGLLYHGAFEFFLLRDIKYVQKYGVKMSLLVFDFAAIQKTKQFESPVESVARVGRIMCDACTPLEHATQLRSGEFAILLCGHDAESALTFAENLRSKLEHEQSEINDLGHIAMGLACMPDHCQEPGAMISAAIDAKNQARRGQQKVMQFKPSRQ